MTDNDSNPTPTTPPSDETQNTGNNGQPPASIPYERFKAVNDERKAFKDRLDALEQAEQQRKQKEALAKGEHEKVIADLEPKAKRADDLEKALKSYLDAELKDVPENYRKFVPQGDVTAQLDWIKQAKAEGLFARTPAPNTDAGAVGDQRRSVKLTDAQREMARKFNMTDEQYLKYLDK